MANRSSSVFCTCSMCSLITAIWFFFRQLARSSKKYSIEYRSVTSQKNKFVKLWDLLPFSNRASLEKGPCQKLALNCNSQLKYKGWKFDTPHINLSNFELVPNWRNQDKFWRVCMGCYQTLIPYISIGNCNLGLIFGMRASLRILYKNMKSYPIISKKTFLWHFGTLLKTCNHARTYSILPNLHKFW